MVSGAEKTRLLNESLQPLFFPYAAGHEIFDVVTKRKALIVQVKHEPDPDGNPHHIRELYIAIRYADGGKIHHITSATLHRRFLPITCLLAMWPDYEKYRDSWISNYISSAK